jgi:hypothetical protein
VSRAAWLAGTALLPLAAVCGAKPPAPQAVFAPPPAPMLLTRTLRHVLHDGRAVATRRSYRVRFARDGAGFRIDGALAEVAVDAPAGLEPLAELERRRPDTGMFPMRLDAQGLIVPTGDPPPSEAQRQAIGTAAGLVAQMSLTAAESAEAQGFVAQFRTRSYRTPWPQDLFHPAPGKRRDERAVPLPGGAAGQVTTELEASADPQTGLLAAFRRKVTTAFGGDSRVVLEEWTLAPVPDPAMQGR